jgi:DNA-binding response OmpR family regulator
MTRICAIQNSKGSLSTVQKDLANAFEVHTAISLESGRELFQRLEFDLILLDLILLDGSGLDFCAMIRADRKLKSLPIIFLTEACGGEDKHRAFLRGADDFVTRPYDVLELRARIHARLKNKMVEKNSEKLRIIGDFKVDQTKQRVYHLKDSLEIDLAFTPFEFKIFQFLSANEGELFSRKALLESVLEHNVHVKEDNIYTHVSSIRKKLGNKSNCLECIPRLGYRFLKNT